MNGLENIQSHSLLQSDIFCALWWKIVREHCKGIHTENPSCSNVECVVHNALNSHLNRNIDAGDLTEQRAIREKLQCKPFKWFMTEVAFDLVKVYPPVEPPHQAEGEVQVLLFVLSFLGIKYVLSIPFKANILYVFRCIWSDQFPFVSHNDFRNLVRLYHSALTFLGVHYTTEMYWTNLGDVPIVATGTQFEQTDEPSTFPSHTSLSAASETRVQCANNFRIRFCWVIATSQTPHCWGCC